MSRKKYISSIKPIWPWILGLILAISMVIFFTKPFSISESPLLLPSIDESIKPFPEEVYNFIEFSKRGVPEKSKDSIAKYVGTAIQMTGLAISGLALATGTNNIAVNSFKTRAWNIGQQLKEKPLLLSETDTLEHIYVEAAKILNDIQKKEFKTLNSEIKHLESIIKDEEQKAGNTPIEITIKAYIQEMASIIKKMEQITSERKNAGKPL
jgi:hypothetical protein